MNVNLKIYTKNKKIYTQENSIFQNKLVTRASEQSLSAASAQGRSREENGNETCLPTRKTFPSREQYSHLLRPGAGSNIK